MQQLLAKSSLPHIALRSLCNAIGVILTFAFQIPIAQADLFAPGVNYVGGLYPGAIAVGDFNGDGKFDAAVINMSSGNVSIFLGQGSGTMQLAPVALSTGIYASRVVVADFNSDGKADLAITNIGSNNIGIYLGNGDGTFRAPTYITAGLAPSGIAVADLNGDGRQDLVVTNASSGTIVGQSVAVLLGNGDGTFRIARTYTSGINPQDVVIGDFNGDGKPDLAVANNNDATISVLLGNGDGTFGPRATFATGFRPYMLRAVDVNGDGRLDLAVVNAFGISIMLGRNDGTFPTVSNIALSFTPNGLAIGDFNGDGLLDLATGNIFGSNVVVLLGNGSGGFQAPISFGTGSGPMAVESVSLRGNGVLDLLVANRSSNNVTVLLNTSIANPPASLLARDGTPQSTQVGTLFPVCPFRDRPRCQRPCASRHLGDVFRAAKRSNGLVCRGAIISPRHFRRARRRHGLHPNRKPHCGGIQRGRIGRCAQHGFCAQQCRWEHCAGVHKRGASWCRGRHRVFVCGSCGRPAGAELRGHGREPAHGNHAGRDHGCNEWYADRGR